MRIKKSDIRKAEFSDASMLNFLIRQCFHDVAARFEITPENYPGYPSNSTMENVQKDLSNGLSFFIKIDHGIPCGCMGLSQISEDTCELVLLGVLPGRRRRGFGKELMEAALFEAGKSGAKRVLANIIAGDTELKKWYRKFGFTENETRNIKDIPLQISLMELLFRP